MTVNSENVPAVGSHTDHELEYMLTRGKPLSHFSDYYPPEPSEIVIPKNSFAPFVVSGRFVERALVILRKCDPESGVRGVVHVLYAQAKEEWRIDQYIDLLIEGSIKGWSESLERQQGFLLGYTESENDLHIERCLADPKMHSWPWVKRARKMRGGI